MSSSSAEGLNKERSLLDFIDSLNFTFEKSAKRSMMSLSLTNTCSVLNFINDILQQDIVTLFKIRFFIFSGLIQNQEISKLVQKEMQGSNNLHRIANLFELS